MTTPHIFLSYSRRDGEQHVTYLEQTIPQLCGREVWRDTRNLPPEQDFTAELEKAIENSSHVIACLTSDTKRENSYVRREIGYAQTIKKPVFVARFEDIPPHLPIVNNTYLDFFRPPPDQYLPTLCEWLSRPTTEEAPVHNIHDPYRPYLESLYKLVVNFLDAAVIRKIDLTAKNRPDQVPQKVTHANPLQARLSPHSWMNKTAPPPKQDFFATFAEAFRAYEGRVVVLGEPGAGKTITLLNQLRESIIARLDDPAQPIPFLGFITSWNAATQPSFADWLSENQPDLTPALVNEAMQTGQAMFYLDGLDELGGVREEENPDSVGARHDSPTSIEEENPLPTSPEYRGGEKITYDPRKRFIEKLGQTINHTSHPSSVGARHVSPLPNTPKIRALVTCRVKDYAEIGEQVPLNGAIELQPLSDDQIAEYLKDLPELYTAVQADDQLKDMLRVPLLMSLFAFAFRDDLTPEQRQELQDMANTDSEELRDKIIMLYLERRYEWEASKGLPMPFSYEEWIEQLQTMAYSGMKTFDTYFSKANQYETVMELNLLKRHNLALDITQHNLESLLKFSRELNIILPLDTDVYRFQHNLFLTCLALPLALEYTKANKVELRSEAIIVLGKLKTKQALTYLDHLLEDEDDKVKRLVSWSLEKIKDSKQIPETQKKDLSDIQPIRSQKSDYRYSTRRYARGTQIGTFALVKELSDRGGMAGVYEAVVNDSQDPSRNGLQVALKIARVTDVNSKMYESLLIKETKFLNDFRHPGIVRIVPFMLFDNLHFYARADNLPSEPWYFAMEMLLGESLSDIILTPKFSLPWKVEMIYQIAVVIDYLHLRQVAHRDLKPDNVMLRYPAHPKQIPTPVLIDFGLTEKRRMSPEVNAATISHASPERVEHLIQGGSSSISTGLNLDLAKSDIWALGIIAYELLTDGQHPFGTGVPRTVLAERIVRSDPIPMTVPVPEKLQHLVYDMLEKDQEKRLTIEQVIKRMEEEIEILAPRVGL